MTTIVDALPDEQRAVMTRAIHLEYWNIGWTISIVVAMGLVLGQSQTMKTAWIEDTLGLVPPLMFLLAAHVERHWKPSRRFPFGFHRVNSLGFFVAAISLATVGSVLLWDSASTLLAAEHATVGSVRLFGRDIWLGWLMLAAQLYSLIPPMIIGRKELPLAEALNDKLLHTDALMNKANWLTGAAGIAGVLGLGLGWWWADSLAAAIISIDVIHDGISAFRAATAELVDGAPREQSGNDLSAEAEALRRELERRFPGADVRMRETGRLIRAEVCGVPAPVEPIDLGELWPGRSETAWRLDAVSFSAW
ncbi:cation transporter [Sphingomonas naphthae]|uniref:Cation transporter n=1 Tax=Sphingomonas naphthae TaxID=1813468 RepID=A0ABY7TK27_9SPHN|nr:cation transporter [Sphingomonas naphthae]WCT72234.1 cation transporter [Sphingomonas naphthae]